MTPSPIPIIFEDNHLLVVEKPVNVPSQEDESGDPDLLSLLKQDLKERHSKPGNVFLGLVHRLDRPTGGIMVFAKTGKAASRLSDQIRRNRFDKKYLAILEGSASGLEGRKGRLRDFLLKNEKTNNVSVVSQSNKGAKEAILDYEVLAEKKGLTLVSVKLLTGRSHQIRVQFASRKFPLYGDFRYGNAVEGRQLALWASELGFDHPISKERLLFSSSPPNRSPWSEFPDSGGNELKTEG